MPSLKTGNELFHIHEGTLQTSLLDFWRWNGSDLLSNATRGRLAEFIVATALAIDTSIPRNEWDSYDLLSREGIKIEIKSSGYVQSWVQKALSKISFGIAPARFWNVETAKYDIDPLRHADVYIFCLLKHTDKSTVDPLNLDQWEFYVVNTKQLGVKKTISLMSLRKICQSVTYFQLKKEVLSKYQV